MIRGWEIDTANALVSAGTDATEMLDWWPPVTTRMLPQAVSSEHRLAAMPSARNVLEADIGPCYARERALRSPFM